jgi:hypothetical protein
MAFKQESCSCSSVRILPYSHWNLANLSISSALPDKLLKYHLFNKSSSWCSLLIANQKHPIVQKLIIDVFIVGVFITLLLHEHSVDKNYMYGATSQEYFILLVQRESRDKRQEKFNILLLYSQLSFSEKKTYTIRKKTIVLQAAPHP